MGDETSASETNDATEVGDVEVFRDLERELIEDNDWEGLADLYRDQAGSVFDDGGASERLAERLESLAEVADEDEAVSGIQMVLGDVYAEELGDQNAAKQAYRSAFVADTTNTESLGKARALYRREGNDELVLKLYELEQQVAQSDRERADILLAKAHVHGDRLGNMDVAIELVRDALALVPDHTVADITEDLYESETTTGEGIRESIMLAKEALREDEPEIAAEFLLSGGRLELERDGGFPERGKVLIRRAAETDPTNSEVIEQYKACFDEKPPEDGVEMVADGGEVQLGLDELELEKGDELDADAGDGDDQEDETAADSEGEPEEELEQEQQETSDEEDDREDGAGEEELEQEQQERPDDEDDREDGAEAEDEQEQASGEDDHEPEVESDEEIEQTQPADLEPESIYESVEPFDGTFEEALEAWEDEHRDLSAFAVVRDRLREEGRYEELAEKIDATLKYLRKKEGESELMGELARLYWKEIGDFEQAEYYFKRLKLLDNTHPDVGAFYEEYYAENEQWRRLFSHLKSRGEEIEDPSEQRRLVGRRARVAEEEMGSPEKAIDVWKNYLRESDDHEARLELQRLYEENEKWNGLVDFLKDEVERLEEQGEETVGRRADLLMRMVDLYEDDIGHTVMALNTLQELVELEPDNVGAFERLRDMLEEGRRWNDLVELLEERAEWHAGRDQIDRAVDGYLEAADVLEEELKHVSRAVEYLEQALEVEPGRDDVRRRLVSVYESKRDYEALYELRESELELYDGSERLQRLYDMLELVRENLRDNDRAIPILEEIIELDTENLDALEELEEVYRRREDWGSLLETLGRKARLLTDNRHRLQALKEAANLHDEHFDDPDRAIQLWEKVARAAPDDEAIADRLASLYLAEDRIEEVRELYGDRGAYEQLYGQLESAAEERDDERAADLYRAMAEVAEEQLGDRDRVVRSLESLLDVTDERADVASELADRYRESGDAEREGELLQIELGETDSDERRLEVLERLSDLAEQREAFGEALNRQIQVLPLAPGSKAKLDRAEQLAEKADDFATFVELAEAIAENLDDADARDQYWRRLGRIEAEVLDRPADAIEHWSAVVERHPEDLEALDALAELYDATGDADALVETLDRIVEIRREDGADRSELVDVLARLADARWQHLDDREDAREAYQEILEIEPDFLPAIRGLKKMHQDDEDWNEVLDLLQRELGLLSTDDEERHQEVQYELAEIYREHLEDLGEALHFYRELLETDPEHEEALEAVKSLLDDPDHARDAAVLLEPLFRSEGRDEELAEALEARLDVTDDDYEREEILEDLVSLYRFEIGDEERGYEYAAQLFKIDPERESVWDELEDLADDLDLWETVQTLFASETPANEQEATEPRQRLLQRVARIRRDRLGDLEEAVNALELLFNWQPDDAEVAQSLEDLYRRLERHEPLVGILEKRAEFAEAEGQTVDFLKEAAVLCDQTLDDPTRATDLYRKILEVAPSDEDAVSALEMLYEDEENWFDLEDLYVDQLDNTFDADRQRRLRLKLAQLRAEHLDDYSGAEQILTTLLDEYPGDPDVIEALEELEVELIKASGDRTALRLSVAESLEPVYREDQNRERLVDVLTVRLREAEDRFERIELLDELANLYVGHLGKQEAGFEMLEKGVVLDPEDEDRRDQFETLGHQLDEIERVVEALDEGADRADSFAAGPLYRRVGDLTRRQLERPEEAIEAYEKVLEIDESDEDALRALEDLYETVEDVEALSDNLRMQARYADPGRRVALWERVGQIERDVLERPQSAIEAYNELLEVEPESAEALGALEELYEEAEDWIDLVDVLRKKASVTPDVEERLETLLKLAGIYEDELHDPDEAIAIYEEAHQIDAASEEAMDALERLYESTDRWADVVDILRERTVSLGSDQEERRSEVELKLADVLRTELYEVDEAIELYRVVRGREPHNEQVIAAFEALVEEPNHAERIAGDLAEYYREVEAWEDLIDLIDRRRDQVADPERRAELAYRAAQIRRDELEAEDEAVEDLTDAWQLVPTKGTYRSELVELVEEREEWERLAEIYRSILPEVQEPDRRIDLHIRLAALERDRLDDPLEAEEHFREVIAIDDRHTEAYEQLDELLVDEERWHDLAEFLETELDLYRQTDPDRAIETLSRQADLQHDLIEDGYAAVDAYERLLELEPTHEEALDGLTELYREQSRWEDLADHLRDRLDVVADPDATVELSFELAEVLRTELYQHDQAVDLYERIVDLDVGHESTVEALESLFDQEPGLEGRLAPLLERIYRYQESWTKLMDVLAVRADQAETPDDRASLLEQAYRLATDEVEDDEWAFEFAGELFIADPGREDVRRDTERLAVNSGEVDELVALYDEALQEIGADVELRAELLCEQGEHLESYLEAPEEARRTYGEALLEIQDLEPAIDALERVLQRERDWEELASFYHERAQAASHADDIKGWYQKLARLEELVRFDLDGAIDAYYSILDVDPDDEHASSAVRRLLAYDGRWHDLADLIRDRIELADTSEERVSLKFRLAQISEGELDDIDEAVQLYREILNEVPGHRDTLRALEGLHRDLANRGGNWRDYRVMIIEELEERYDRDDDWRRIVDLLGEKRELVDGYEAQSNLLCQQAERIVKGPKDNVERMPALSKLAEAYCLNPRDQDVWTQFEALADRLDCWARVPAVLLPPLREAEDPEQQASILIALGDAYRDKIGDKRSAVTAYQTAADVHPDSEAIGRLESLLSELELWEPLVDILESKLESVVEPDERIELLNQLGTLYDDVLEKPYKAAPYYEDLMAEEPDEASHYERLQSIYERTGRYEELEELLGRRLEVVEDENQQIGLLRRLATIQDDYLEHQEGAIETYRTLHDHEPDDQQVVSALVRLYEETGRWPELIEMLELQQDFAESLEEVNDLTFQRGQIQFEELDEPVDAFEAFEQILEREPQHEAAREAMVELTSASATSERASELLQEMYRNEEDWERLQELFEHQLEVVDQPDRRGELYMELAQLHEEQLENRHMAFAMLGRAFREMPSTVYLRHELDRLSGRLDNPEELLAMYEDALDAGVDDPDLVRDLHLKAGEIAADAVGDYERGIEHAEQALELDEFDRDVLEMLDRLYQQNNDWDDLVEILERRLDIAEEEELNDIRFRLGYLHEVMFEENDMALDYYREVILDEPGHGPVVEALERLVEEAHLRRDIADLLEPAYRDQDQYDRLVQLLDLQLDIVDDDVERATLNKRIAELHGEKLDNPQIGYAYYGRALRADPLATDIQERLETLAEELDRFDEIVAMYEDLLDDLTDPMRVVEFAESAADWALRELEAPERAGELYEEILEVEPEHEDALDGLETVARESRQPERLAEVLERKADTAFEPEDQREILLELADVRMELEHYEQAADAYQQALLLDESDTEVMRKLIGLYEVTDQYDELVDVLDRLRSYEKDPEELVSLNLEIGRYCHHFLDEPDRAMRAYRQVLEQEPNHLDALGRLEELLREGERWAELQDVLQNSLDLAEEREDDEEIVRLSTELGMLAYERFEEVDPAIEWFDRALEIESGHPDVIEALEEIYRQEGQWDELMELLEEQLTLAEDDQAAADLLVDMARINFEYLDELDVADEYLDEAFALDPQNQKALQMRGQIFRERGDWPELLEVFEIRIEAADTLDRELELRRERADVYEEEMDKPNDAIRDYQEILEYRPLDEELLEHTKQLYEQTDNLHGKYGLLEHEAEHVDDPEREIELYLEMAEMADAALDQPELAIDALERAYEMRPDDLDIAESLIEAYLDVDRVDEAEPLIEEMVETLIDRGETDDAARFQHKRGKLAQKKGDLEAAEEAYEGVFELDDSFIPNLLSLGKLHYQKGEFEEAKDKFQKLLLHQMKLESDAQKVDVYYHLGMIREELGDARRAKDMFNRALSINSEHEASQEALRNLDA